MLNAIFISVLVALSIVGVLAYYFQAQQSKLNMLRSELMELSEKFDLITTNIAASVILYNSQWKGDFCSPYTGVLTGYLLEEINNYPGDFFEHIILDSDRDRYRRAKAVSQLGEDIFVRYQIRHASGLKLWLETRFVPVCDFSDEVKSILAVTIDVTDSLNYQRQIEDQNRDLSDFTFMVSHDLKAPIFTIRGMAEAIKEDYSPVIGEDGVSCIKHISEAAKRLEQLIASVIYYCSVSTKEMKEQSVDLKKTIQSVIDDLHEQIKQSQAEIIVEGTFPEVNGDEIRIYQVISNLIGNAIKYRSPERTPQIKIRSSKSAADFITLEIIDNGRGIPQTKYNDIFRPYQRLNNADTEGNGIGLASVKKIVERLGGSVSVESELGSGSIFFVTLAVKTSRNNVRHPFPHERYEQESSTC
jgi:PAS domain S-box-containing protein